MPDCDELHSIAVCMAFRRHAGFSSLRCGHAVAFGIRWMDCRARSSGEAARQLRLPRLGLCPPRRIELPLQMQIPPDQSPGSRMASSGRRNRRTHPCGTNPKCVTPAAREAGRWLGDGSAGIDIEAMSAVISLI